ncbi:MAG: O-methyltransferase [Leadbetterella sp.]
MSADLEYDYCQSHSGIESLALQQIARDTHVKQLKPRMLSGHLQGRLLSLLSKLKQPKNVLEIGTFTGYSAICLAEGLAENGTVITIEANEELEGTIKNNFGKAGLSSKIQLILGNAIEVIPTLKQTFDLVFIDADKKNYLSYYKMVIDKVNSGGLILSDNVLWDSKVYQSSYQDDTTKHLREYNDFLHQDTRTEKVLIPLRDGLFVSRKI